MVRVQIGFFEKADFDEAANALSFCVKDAKRELLEYMQNPSVVIFTAKENAFCAIAIVMLTDDFADLIDIAVLQKERRRGIAEKLLLHIFDFCRQKGVLNLLLEVRESNAPAISLYEKCGFEKINVRKKYYSDPLEDAVIYRREL